MSPSLESRLRALEIEVPAGLAARAKTGAAARPTVGRRRLPALARTLAVLAVLAVAANAVVTYFAPAYGQALADSPIGPLTQPLLRAGGLSAGDVTPVDQSVTSSGHTIQVVGAYADGIQTTIYMQVDGRPLAAPAHGVGKVWGDRYLAAETLTDQFGRSYEPRGTSGTTVTVFEPLAGPAAALGGRLTLHVTRLWLVREGPDPGNPESAPHVDGDWTFRFTLTQRPAHDLPLPGPLRIGDTTYTFTAVQAASVMTVKIRVSGGAVERWNAATSGRVSGPLPSDVIDPYLTELYDEGGRAQRGGYGGGDGATIDRSWVLHGPGRYRLHIGDVQSGVDVWFTVPGS